MGAIFRREMGAFFASPIAYVYLTIYYLFAGVCFYLFTLSYGIADMASFFSMLFWAGFLLIPVLTMRSFSEEKMNKTDQGLLTAPVSLGGIVLGKYFAALAMYTIGIAIIFVYALILSFFGAVTWGIVAANFIALFLLGAAFISVGVLISSLTENQFIAYIISLLLLYVMCVMQELAGLIENASVPDIFQPVVSAVSTGMNAISFYNKFYDFTCGLFDLSSVLFYVSFAAVFNFLTVRVLETRRWR
ncbi:MAG: ABC-2 transporter permease [Oscillospiraceae bacterium]|nr:ABC-2 transporter permease [Oscillospiraceae bacterium]